MITDKPTVTQVLQNVRALSPQEQLDLLEQIAALLRASLPPQPAHSILELEGLGAAIWRGVRAQAYVNQERAAWDG
jgi:hypothetical protein